MSTKRILSILLGYVFILCFPSHAKAWDEETLRALALDALQLAPAEMKTFLERHKDHILDGVAWPHRHLLRGLDDPHEAHDPVQHAATHLQRERVGILQAWNKQQPNEIWIAGRMGAMAHYIGDILRPQRFSPRDSHVHTRDMLKNYDIFVFYE